MARPDEAFHERARLLAADAIDGELEPRDADWLRTHLDQCAECRDAAADFASIRAELRALPAPIPPRNLWARTAAGLDAVDRSRSHWFPGVPRIAAGSPSMLGSMVAVAVVVVLVGVSIVTQPMGGLRPNGGNGGSGPSGSQTAFKSAAPTAQPSLVAILQGNNVVVVDPSTNQLLFKAVDCTAADTCTVSDKGGAKIAAGDSLHDITMVAVDADAKQAAISTKTSVKVAPVTHAASPTPIATPSMTPSTPVEPTATPSGPLQTASPLEAAVTILEGYQTVGEAQFSPDGAWLAFAARPANGSVGPDVFVWHAGDAVARPITTSHAAVFSGWWNKRVLLSEVLPAVAVPPVATETPSNGSASPSPEATATAGASPETSASAAPSVAPSGLAPLSYLVDPSTCAADRLELASFRPLIDPSGTRIVYWSGTVGLDASGQPKLQSGDLYYDLWSNVPRTPVTLCGSGNSQPSPSASSSESPSPTAGATAAPSQALPSGSEPAANASAHPAPSPTPAPPALPQRVPVADPGALDGDWVAQWDPSGLYLGVAVADAADPSRGQLTVYGVDLGTGKLSVDTALLAIPAKSGFQMTATGVVYTSPAGVGDGNIHQSPWPPAPQPTPPTPAPSGPDQSELPGS